MEFKGILERIEPRSPERVTALIIRSIDKRIEMELEVPNAVLNLLDKAKLKEGAKVSVNISKKGLKADEWELLMNGNLYLAKESEGVRVYFVSLGGLRCRIRSARKPRWKLMDKLYVGLNFIE
ncbi:MAG TPA: hypothetical protein ENF53_03360 [Thermoprotei archaeon]|nr:hypothetical protein [Thermoprotei archaeon]